MPVFVPTGSRRFFLSLVSGGELIPNYQDIRGVLDIKDTVLGVDKFNIMATPSNGSAEEIAYFHFQTSNESIRVRENPPYLAFNVDYAFNPHTYRVTAVAYDEDDKELDIQSIIINTYSDTRPPVNPPKPEPPDPPDPEPPNPEPPIPVGPTIPQTPPTGYKKIAEVVGNTLNGISSQQACSVPRSEIIFVQNQPELGHKMICVDWKRKHYSPECHINLNNRRAEIIWPIDRPGVEKKRQFAWGVEHYMAVELYLDKTSYKNPTNQCIWQIHGGNGPVALLIQEEDKLRIRFSWREQADKKIKPKYTWFELGESPYDKLFKFELYLRLDWKKNGNGYVSIFVDGEAKVPKTDMPVGDRAWGNNTNIYVKSGVYKAVSHKPNVEGGPRRLSWQRHGIWATK